MLEQISDYLKQTGFDCSHDKDLLHVTIGQDAILQLRVDDERMPTGLAGDEEFHYQFLHLFLVFPTAVEEKHFGDTARLMSLLNKVAVVPGFILSETDKTCVFRAIHLISKEFKHVDFLVSAIAHSVDIFASAIEEVATGKKSLKALLKEAESETAV
ncbi:MAG: hypothetical protein SP1CHLAM54_06690 [Chlamydiia bacterium]|nr:hypothetical protein [Chlamydiia bacterium]MCH9615578.1 hypothetical protein [Chlamydiia bacterium]MCH9629233.1 hypothetical protein [Chlamydiia bacterium]